MTYILITPSFCTKSLIFSLMLLVQDGMQKEIFDKFISKLEKHCEIISIGSEVDYRRVAAKNSVENV